MRDNHFAEDCGKFAEETKGIKEIKPCPFCGGKASYKDIGFLLHTEHVYVVSCSACGCSTPINEDLIEAIKSWNKRVNVAKVTNNQFADVGKKDTMSLTLALIVLDRLNTTERVDIDCDELIAAVKAVKPAARKQIPLPLVTLKGRTTNNSGNEIPVKQPCCPTCGEAILNAQQQRIKFCPECGQAVIHAEIEEWK